MTNHQTRPLLRGEVARRLGICISAVSLHHDKHLNPRRSETGVRIYDREIVERYAVELEARRAAKLAARMAKSAA